MCRWSRQVELRCLGQRVIILPLLSDDGDSPNHATGQTSADDAIKAGTGRKGLRQTRAEHQLTFCDASERNKRRQSYG